MQKDMKKVYSYGLIMIVAVLVIVFVACLSESRLDNAQEEYENMLISHQGEIDELEKENSELREKINQNIDVQSKLDIHNQIMNELAEIYNLLNDGKKDQASEKLGKIETNGFDDGELAFYNAIKNLIETEDK